MSFGHASNSLSIFGQQPEIPIPAPPGSALQGPQLAVRWGSFRQSAASSVRAIMARPWAPKKSQQSEPFSDRWDPDGFGGEAIVAAIFFHIMLGLLPWSRLEATPHKNPALENFQLTWSGPINDLPPLNLPGLKAPTPSPRGNPENPPAPEGADAFHPRQRIFTDPAVVTHPRQTLINPAAPATPPKILPNLPNIVELQPAAVPAKPKIQIDEQALAQLHPREHRVAAAKATPAPEMANAEAGAGIILETSPNAPARPKLELNSGAAPRLTQQRAQAAESPAPELARQNPANAASSTLIALSATPGPVAPVAPPQGNLAARVAISPEGKNPGAPGGQPPSVAPNNGGSKGSTGSRSGAGVGNSAATANSTGVSISGGNPTAKTMSGLGDGKSPLKLDASARGLSTKFDPHARVSDEPERTSPPNFAALAPGAKPEQVFNSKKVYTLLVNMPNLNSATGSWVLNFSELHSPGPAAPGDLNGPSPLRKSDPKYPPTLAREHVEGEVILYAVIRDDGSVDSVQLIRGIDEQLDANAMQALTQWKFRPASRQGTPVALEAIVHIPFRAPGESLIR